MAANIAAIFPKAPYTGIARLTGATPIATRTDITGTTGLVPLTTIGGSNTDGLRIDRIRIKSKATSVASILSIWYYDGTTSSLWDEIDIAATVASTTADSNLVTRSYTDLNLPATHQLYISQTIATDVTVYAHGGIY